MRVVDPCLRHKAEILALRCLIKYGHVPSDIEAVLRVAAPGMLGDICRDKRGLALHQAMQKLQRAAASLAKFSPDQPRVPAGNPDGGQWTRGGDGGDAATTETTLDIVSHVDAQGNPAQVTGDNESAGLKSWGNPKTLAEHFEKHGSDFNAASAADYANQANRFYQRAQDEKLPTVEGQDGTLRIYDPATNTFGSYNADGTTKTFYKPPQGQSYFQEQIDKDLLEGGRLINPLRVNPSRGGGGGMGGIGPVRKPTNPWDDIEE